MSEGKYFACFFFFAFLLFDLLTSKIDLVNLRRFLKPAYGLRPTEDSQMHRLAAEAGRCQVGVCMLVQNSSRPLCLHEVKNGLVVLVRNLRINKVDG